MTLMIVKLRGSSRHRSSLRDGERSDRDRPRSSREHRDRDKDRDREERNGKDRRRNRDRDRDKERRGCEIAIVTGIEETVIMTMRR